MKVTFIKLFQPINAPMGTGSQATLSVTDKDHSLILEGDWVRVTHRSGGSILVSTNNVCYMKVEDEPANPAPTGRTKGTSAPKGE